MGSGLNWESIERIYLLISILEQELPLEVHPSL